MSDYTVNPNSAVYYSHKYWNELPIVKAHIHRRISGDPDIDLFTHFADRVPQTFLRALILNCGNGWVERDLFARGMIAEAIGIDCSESLLDDARSSAHDVGFPADYYLMDVNSAAFPTESVDLAVNYAAGHHIACLDRVFRTVCEILPDDGWYLGYDYVGPHRNQYGAEAWDEIWRVNELLPSHLRQALAYPHLPTMLLTDPTEAIHSELVLRVFRRYFEEVEYVSVGGAIAYPLLTFNDGIFAAPEEEQTPWVQQVLDADVRFLESHPDSSLFTYFTGRPKKEVLADHEQLRQWTEEETKREASAQAEGGEYYPRTALAVMSITAEQSRAIAQEEKLAIDRLDERVKNLEGELQTLRSSTSYRLAVNIASSPLAGAARKLARVSPVERALRRWLHQQAR